MAVGEQAHHTGEHEHPGPIEYVKIAVVLAVATALEVALFYVGFLPEPAVVGLLLTFMVIKFALVVLWFMHLRFDSRLFRKLFVTGIILAVAVYTIVLATFGVFTR
jgi:cytochrome c oxidase subunit 4